MDINKEELAQKFREEDWEYVFKQVLIISDYLVAHNYKIYDPDIKDDMVQECAENFYKKVLANKVDPEQNVFAFIWKNSNFRILEILRKQRKRNNIARFFSYDEIENSDFIDYKSGAADKYAEKVWIA